MPIEKEKLSKEYCCMEEGALCLGWPINDDTLATVRCQAEKDIKYLSEAGVEVEDFELHGDLGSDDDVHWACAVVHGDMNEMEDAEIEKLIQIIEGAGFSSASWLF